VPFTENQGAKIYWDAQGSGEPILLIMGLGWTSHMWYRSRPALVSANYRTIAFDNRGVGQSDIPSGPYPLSVMASDAAAVLDAAGVERAHIHGVSMGGMIAQEFALQYPQRVRSLILGCTAAGGPNAVQAEPSVIQTLLRTDLNPAEAAEAANSFIYASHTPRARVDEDMALRLKWSPKRDGFMAQLQGIMIWEADSRLSRIASPTIVIHGDADRLVPSANGRRIAGLIPGAQTFWMPGAGHIYATDQPGMSEKVILEFLAQADHH
jgi:pimeloyl-ACP methyl ester carboxylesterase